MKLLKKIAGKYRAGAAAATASALALQASPAMAQGLTKAKSALETFQSELTTIIPIAAAVILLALGIGYAGKFIEKDTFVRWAVGVMIAGSVVQITALFFS